MAQVLAPSDLQRFQGPGKVPVGGRVIFISAQELIVADALASISIACNKDVSLTPGDLVVCEVWVTPPDGTRSPGYRFSQLLNARACPEPRGGGEFMRLSRDRRGTILAARHRAMRRIREYFEDENFIEVDTPTFAPCPGLDPHVASLGAINRGTGRDFLMTSPELHMKRLLVGGLPRIFQVARCFRADENGDSHEPEFTLLEWYRAFSNFDAIVDDTEELVSRVFDELSETGCYPGGKIERPFHRITVREAFERYCGGVEPIGLSAEKPDEFFRLMVEQVEPGLTKLERPVFLTHYPLSQAALAQPSATDPSVAERFELYLGEVELSNGYGELTDAGTQRKRFEQEQQRRRKSNEEVYPLDERFLAGLEEGMPAASGNALGLDRLITLAVGATKIQQTIAFADAER